ncbi:MAG: hypothetical protein AAF645_14675 [Myxococcota bacterium]
MPPHRLRRIGVGPADRSEWARTTVELFAGGVDSQSGRRRNCCHRIRRADRVTALGTGTIQRLVLVAETIVSNRGRFRQSREDRGLRRTGFFLAGSGEYEDAAHCADTQTGGAHP